MRGRKTRFKIYKRRQNGLLSDFQDLDRLLFQQLLNLRTDFFLKKKKSVKIERQMQEKIEFVGFDFLRMGFRQRSQDTGTRIYTQNLSFFTIKLK